MQPYEEIETPMGEVLNFPHRHQADTEPATVRATAERLTDDQTSTDEVVDAEVMEPSTEVAPRKPVLPPALAAKGVPTAKSLTKAAARHAYYLAGGAFDTFGAVYARWTGRDIDAQIRAAQAAGEHGVAAQLAGQRTDSRKLFLERIKVFGELLVQAPQFLAYSGGLFVVITLIVAVVAQIQPGGLSFISVWTGLFDAIATGFDWAVWAASWAPWAGLAALLGVLVKGYNARRNAGAAPSWTMPNTDGTEGREVVPDEGAILEALRHLGISKLDQAFKAGWGAAGYVGKVFEQPTARDGKGWRTQIVLPQGVTVDMINRRKDVLAHNLVRMPVEVWPTQPRNKPGVLDLWVADQGSLTGPVDPWPLLADLDTVVTDYFKGVPVGVNIRGDQIRGRLSEANWGVAGTMGSGKSTLVINAVLGAMLDPLVDIDVFVMAENADYQAMEPRLRTLVTGIPEETGSAAACLDAMRDLYAELGVRGRALKEHDQRAVTRELAEKDERLRPRVVVIDECQALFMDSELGEEAADLTTKLIGASRKYGFTLIFLTPEPSTASLPRKVVSVLSNKACFAIGDQQSNDAILGTGSYTAGISAVGLSPKVEDDPGDVGTAMTRGFMREPGLMRSYYVPQDDVHRVTRRALEIREAANVTTEHVQVERDVLADVLAVTGGEETRASKVVAALGARWAHYQGWKIQDLKDALAAFDVKVPSTDGKHPVDPTKVREAQAHRDANAAG